MNTIFDSIGIDPGIYYCLLIVVLIVVNNCKQQCEIDSTGTKI